MLYACTYMQALFSWQKPRHFQHKTAKYGNMFSLYKLGYINVADTKRNMFVLYKLGYTNMAATKRNMFGLYKLKYTNVVPHKEHCWTTILKFVFFVDVWYNNTMRVKDLANRAFVMCRAEAGVMMPYSGDKQLKCLQWLMLYILLGHIPGIQLGLLLRQC